MERQHVDLQVLWSENRRSMMQRVDDVVACLGPASPPAAESRASVLCGESDLDPALVRLACLSLASRLLENDPARARVVRSVHRWFDQMAEDGVPDHRICASGNAVASAIYAQAIDVELRRRGFASSLAAWDSTSGLDRE